MNDLTTPAQRNETMTTFQPGDVFSLPHPLTFGAVDANGEPIAGLSLSTSVVTVVAVMGNTVYLSPALNADIAILNGTTKLYPLPLPPPSQKYDPKTGLPLWVYVGSGFTDIGAPWVAWGFTGGSQGEGDPLYTNPSDTPNQPPSSALVSLASLLGMCPYTDPLPTHS